MKYIEEEPVKERHIINMGKPNAKVDPLSIALYSEKIEKRYDRDEGYRLTKMKAIEKEYNKIGKRNKLRIIGEWLWDFVRANGTYTRTSYGEISENLKISEGVIRVSISKLNYWEGYPFTWIPVPRKTGFIQLSLNNEDDYYKWDLKKEKIIVSNEQVKSKAEKITPKRKVKEKQKVAQIQR